MLLISVVFFICIIYFCGLKSEDNVNCKKLDSLDKNREQH